MSDTDPISDSPQEQQGRPVVTLVVAAIVVIAMSLSAWVLFHDSPLKRNSFNGATTIKLNMSSAEKEYLSKLFVKDIALSRAENFLHQEVTILSGTIMNGGSQTVTELDLTVQFSDQMDQIALRETRGVLGTPPVPIGPGQERTFEISFDHVPTSWNMQQPTLRVANIALR